MADAEAETIAYAPAGSESRFRASEARRRRILTLSSFGFMLFAWFALTGFGTGRALVDPVFLPSPGAVLERFLVLCTKGYQGVSLLHHVLVSMMRFGVAFTFCVVVGVAVGLL